MQKKKLVLIIVLGTILVITFLVVVLSRKNDGVTTPSKTSFDISSPNTDEGVRDIFQKYLNENFDEKNTGQARYFQLVDSQDKIILLDRFANNVGLIINPAAVNLISNNSYSLFYCSENGEKSYGITFGAKVSDHDNYAEIAMVMKNWEPTLFSDTKSIIFPRITDSNFVSLNSNIEFKDGDFRYSDINMPDGSKKSINYYVNSAAIFISSSRECLYSTFPDAEKKY